MRISRIVLGVVLCLGLGVFATSAYASTTSGGGDSSSGIVAKAKKIVADRSKPITDWPSPPPSPTPQQDKTIFVISIDQRLEGSVRAVDGVKEAADILGWEVETIDGQSNPDALSAGIDRAVQQKADGIVLIYINQDFVKSSVKGAREAGIPIVSVLGGNKPGPDGVNADSGDASYTRQLGETEAYFAIAKSNGKAKAVVLKDTSFPLSIAITDGTEKILGQCKTCELIDTVEFTGADVVTKLAGLTQTAVTRSSDADWVIAPYDAAASVAVQGVTDASKADSIRVVGTGGNLPNLEAIGEGGPQVATVGQTLEWPAFAAMDNINRIMNGEKPVQVKLPLRILTKKNLPPPGEPWTGDFDFVSMYKELWNK